MYICRRRNLHNNVKTDRARPTAPLGPRANPTLPNPTRRSNHTQLQPTQPNPPYPNPTQPQCGPKGRTPTQPDQHYYTTTLDPTLPYTQTNPSPLHPHPPKAVPTQQTLPNPTQLYPTRNPTSDTPRSTPTAQLCRRRNARTRPPSSSCIGYRQRPFQTQPSGQREQE